ncbi:hypothetical protein EDB19DRAFT_1667464 [Suillus lakei]|nr:hypothetical protein EDB19DRAFT_1667464 [Suillus lakei]
MSLLTKALVVILVAATVVPGGAFAQSSKVTCLSSFGWMNNSLTQDPCVVASYLLSVCVGSFVMTPLSLGWVYVGPSTAEDSCGCSSVTYSMMSACADYQNCSYVSWSSWSSSCSMTSFREYPMDIPTGTRVPNWAYLNVSSTFDSVAAQNAGDLPEAVPTNVQSTVTVTYSTTMSASLSTMPTSSAAATGLSTTSASNSTSLNVRAIAGGVVGGTVGAAVIIGLATWFLVKRRRSAAFSDIGGGPGNTNPFPMQPQVTQQLRLYVCFS